MAISCIPTIGIAKFRMLRIVKFGQGREGVGEVSAMSAQHWPQFNGFVYGIFGQMLLPYQNLS